MCDYTYFDTERNCLKVKIRVNEIYHLEETFCIIILTIYSAGVVINVSKTGKTKSFSETQFMVHRTERIRNILCYFPRISSMR